MTKFSTYVGDALKFHDTTHGALRAAVRLATRDDDMMGTMTEDDWSPEARAAALKARQASATARGKTEGAYDVSQHRDAAKAHRSAGEAHVHASQINPEHTGAHMTAAREHSSAEREHRNVVRLGSKSAEGQMAAENARKTAYNALNQAKNASGG